MIDDARKPNVLIVDDQPLNIRILYETLRDDCTCFMATNGTKALAHCRETPPDLILLDVMLPDISGHEVCRQLKADYTTEGIPIIFITGQLDAADELKGFELGAVDFIRKPVNPVITRARVRTQLTLKRQADLLRSMAGEDSLTGVANRRRFDEELAVSWLQCSRDRQPLSLILMDIDHFKRFNDRYGHPAGDDCLRRVAQAARACARRPRDLVARYGGEEFACILPDTDLKGGLAVASAILAAVQALRIEHRGYGLGGVVTLSLGVACVVPEEGKAAELVAAADRQLYDAKAAGRARAFPPASAAA